MKKSMKLVMGLAVFFAVIVFTYIPSNSSNDSVDIRMSLGSGKMTVNGSVKIIEKPVLKGSSVYVPMRAVLEAFGAEVNWKGNGKILLLFRDTSIELTLGSKKCEVNQKEEELPAPIFKVNGATMIPIRFISEHFGAKVEYNNGTKSIRVLLEDDGALTDLSFLTDGIGKSKIGNSYFGWSINIPKGSRINHISFNSKNVSIINLERQLSLDVNVYLSDGKLLTEVFDDISEDSKKYFDGEIMDASLNEEMGFGEFFLSDEYSGASYVRMYVENEYTYFVEIRSSDFADPAKIKNSTYFAGIMDSFELGFKGNVKDVQDLSTIKFGLAKYENYINYSSEKKYLSWEIDVLPEWDILRSEGESPFFTKIGLGNKEYIGVQIEKNESKDLLAYAGDVKADYDENFNKKYYEFIGEKIVDIAGKNAYKMVFSLKTGDVKYIVEEVMIEVDGLIFDVTLKVNEERYKKESKNFNDIINSIMPSKKEVSLIKKDIESYRFEEDKRRVSKSDEITETQNKTYKWKIKLPGNWMKEVSKNEDNMSFSDNHTGMSVGIAAVENTSQTKGLPDEEKFEYLGSIAESDTLELMGKENIKTKDLDVRIYKYRIEDSEEDIFANIQLYVFEKDKYSYCFTTVIPDLSSTEKNIKKVNDIWESFSIEGEAKQ
ncbi:MAG: copper amine oxidase N-terminal domain-containing protein [Clostridia bacterium]|nr:copper amine oxidase N-terminal domain-containing protein [Clostridia bacterium]